MKFSEFDIIFKVMVTIKGHALANFGADVTPIPEMEMEPTEPSTWNLFVDGSLRESRSETGVVLVSLEGHKLNCTVRFNFKATNNAAEYEALLASLRLAKEMQMKLLLMNSDSQLVVS